MEPNERPNPKLKNPKRVAAGKANRAKRCGITAAGREQLRASALLHRPWEHSTGPRTPAGKVQARKNGKAYRQSGTMSIHEARAWSQAVTSLLADVQKLVDAGIETLPGGLPV